MFTNLRDCKQIKITVRYNSVYTLLLYYDNARGRTLQTPCRVILLYISLASTGPQTELTTNLIFSSVFFYNTLLQLSFPLMLPRKESSGRNFSYHLASLYYSSCISSVSGKEIFILIDNNPPKLACIWLGSRNNRNFPF